MGSCEKREKSEIKKSRENWTKKKKLFLSRRKQVDFTLNENDLSYTWTFCLIEEEDRHVEYTERAEQREKNELKYKERRDANSITRKYTTIVQRQLRILWTT